jgi:BirA family biotin operon repressor/biotin-[acetyl-CoA-carboxylase] ligase
MYSDFNLSGFLLARRYTSVSSTMDVARELLCSESSIDPSWCAAVIADEQTAGRGRQGRSWLASAGAFMATYVFVTDAPTAILSGYSLSVGVAVARALEAFGVGVALKWPNDVVVEYSGRLRKLGGILIEVQELGGYRGVLVGLGINVTPAPVDLRDIAVSLSELGQRALSAVDLVIPLGRALKQTHDRFIAGGGFKSVRSDWVDRSAFIQQVSRLTIDLGAGEEISGTFSGVDDHGALLLGLGAQRRSIISGHITSYVLRQDF